MTLQIQSKNNNCLQLSDQIKNNLILYLIKPLMKQKIFNKNINLI